MTLLHAGVDTSVIALWLGHEGLESTKVYLHADVVLTAPAAAPRRPQRWGLRRRLLCLQDLRLLGLVRLLSALRSAWDRSATTRRRLGVGATRVLLAVAPVPAAT